MNSPDLRMKNHAINKTIIDKNQAIEEHYVDEVIKRHRHTFSRRMVESKQEKTGRKGEKIHESNGKKHRGFQL